MKPTKDAIARQFGSRSVAYAQSPTHARGEDLEILRNVLDPSPRMAVLDVATGAGHTAATVALRVRLVVGIDLAPEMIAQTRALARSRGLANITGLVMDVEALGFAAGSFDAVMTRLAPHHFPDPAQAVREIARVLAPGGAFVMEDSSAPSDPGLDEWLNEVERLKDPTHVRSYTEQEWRDMLSAAGLTVLHTEVFRKAHTFQDWLARAGLSEEGSRRVESAFVTAGPEARAHFAMRFENGRPVAFTDDKLILRAERP